jgi:hypothetical protein
MMTTAILLGLLVGVFAAGGILLARTLRRCGLNSWLATYIREIPRRQAPLPGQPIHVLLCLADHYEPEGGQATPEVARNRVERWVREYPRLLSGFHDSDGRPPQHTFFYPIEEYEAEYLDALAGLCRAGYGEVEVHLHHDGATAEELTEQLEDFKNLLARRHGLLARHRETGELAYGFIHGNWALNNSRADGRWCGVNDEIRVLRATGCYADFTLPSVPDPSQTRKINSIYYAASHPHRPKGHDWGQDIGRGPAPADTLLLIQGALVLNWGRRKWGLVPRIENSCIQGNQAPNMDRLNLWLKACVRVPDRPDWYFVKLHTHGAKEENAAVLLGEAMVRFHESLARRMEREPWFHVHYVTAREMYNLARAAEAGWKGSVDAARDFELVRNGIEAHGLQPVAVGSIP